MDFPKWLKIVLWIILIILSIIFLINRIGAITSNTYNIFDIFIFLLLIILLITPLFQEVNLFGFRIKRELDKIKNEVRENIINLRADIQNTIDYNATYNPQIKIGYLKNIEPEYENEIKQELEQKPDEDENQESLNKYEYKLLNTLWTKQINKFPNFKRLFTFRLNQNADQYYEFRIAGANLILKELIWETKNGQYFLTARGVQYCIDNYRNFPNQQWLGNEPLNKENLDKILTEMKSK